MGCANGMCGMRRPAEPTANAGCAMCDQDRYRLRMRAAYNPWGNAGKVLPGGGSAVYQGGDTTDDPGNKGGSGGGSTPDYVGLIQTGIRVGGDIARAQIEADSRRADADARARAAQALIDAGYGSGSGTRSSQEASTSNAGGASGGGSGGMLLLVGLGLAAGVMSGAIKLPKMR